jgi:hypothetical protein
MYYLEATFKKQDWVSVLSKAYLSKIKDFTSNHARLLASGFVLPKATK